ncbi:LacI family DNA-binding transcriptional regulator [Oceaniglobus indicus]|uniref:LacI family DNA-binding transcriptional regulator n=1 Tax=Oceaniglobus indicus TaxID=2047749 RepID=UPI000C19532B|nr:LacI family DNA-binding transcriptional regulator [Oceaniglobus indicus]
MNLRDLARIIGVSQTTVSRALNGYPEVSAATRARIVAAAREHNYRPNTRAAGLATGRSMAIAHVFPVSLKAEMVNPIFNDFFVGAAEVYAERGYDMMLSVIDDSPGSRAVHDLGARRSADGIIFHAPRNDRAVLEQLRATGLPFVVHGRFADAAPDYHWVDMNNRRAFGQATAFLADLGHRRIALINGHASMDFARRRREGVFAALRAAGIAPDPDLVFNGEMTEFHGFEATCAALDHADPPTAIIVSSLIMAMGVRRACDARGLRLGRDLSVITHDDVMSFFRNGGDVPDFTSLRSPIRDHGRAAATLLLRVIDDPSLGPQNVMLDAVFTLGLSTGPAHPLPRKRHQG